MAIITKQMEIIPVKENLDGELDQEIYYECNFCNKRTALHPFSRHMCEVVSGSKYYCDFCLRHGFHTKNNRNILILTFKSIFSHFYKELHLDPTIASHKIYLAEIRDYIQSHMRTGLLNPVFSYDQETFFWFVDFSKVGKGSKKLKLNDVLKTIINILACFNLKTNVPAFSTHLLYAKYKDAIERFHASRYRPSGKRILAPSLNTYVYKTDPPPLDYDMFS